MQDRKNRSLDHEIRVAKALGGQRVPASGALGHPGDVRTNLLLVSAKHTGLRSYGLDLAEVERIAKEADGEGLVPVMALDFAGIAPGVERDWALLPLRVVAGLIVKAHEAPPRPRHQDRPELAREPVGRGRGEEW